MLKYGEQTIFTRESFYEKNKKFYIDHIDFLKIRKTFFRGDALANFEKNVKK